MTDQTETLKKLYITLKKTQERLAKLEGKYKEPIAIIGMACRFPGGANNPQKYWELLLNKKDAVITVPKDRWNASRWCDPDPEAPGRMYTSMGGFLDQPIDMFDAPFFNISPKEAASLDPQQRLLLEVSWEAFENANIPVTNLKGSKSGVFIGMSSDDYALAHRHSGQHHVIDAYAITGTTFSTASGRISYTFGLEGPCMAVDTACSSAMVAVHLACRSLREGESDLVLAGAVNLMLSPESHICFSKLRAISPDGHCKSFDAMANGYARGEGCGMVVLKRLTDARNDGDQILAVIRGTAVNQDGKSNGLTAPNVIAQQKVILAALENAGLPPAAISFIETHGTGTSLGDPIEAEAIGKVFSNQRKADEPIFLGSCKSNIGHLEPASGMAALIKTVLALNHHSIPANIHFNTPSPYIPWDTLPIKIPVKSEEWHPNIHGRVAGINSFGFSGTNAHIIISEAPIIPSSYSSNQEKSMQILAISAKTEASANTLKTSYINFLKETANSAPDICHAANCHRDHFEFRLVAMGTDTHELSNQLEKKAPVRSETPAAPAFLFTGQGSQYKQMGQELFRTQPVFKKAIQTCDEILEPLISDSLIRILYDNDTNPEILNQTRYTQPAIFAIEYAMYKLWLEFGITPGIVLGHSVGEYVAACAAGIFSLEDGLKLISHRGRLMQSLPPGGAMASVMLDEAQSAALISNYLKSLSIAAINGPNHTVISGDAALLNDIVEQIKVRKIKVTPLKVSHAFHSPLMEPILDEFEQIASEVEFQKPKIFFVSNVSGQLSDKEILTSHYWREHIRKPVQFFESMKTLKKNGVKTFIEIGPQPVLVGMGQLAIQTDHTLWLPSLRPRQSDWKVLSGSLSELYTGGFNIEWEGLYNPLRKSGITIPNYQFERRSYWMDIPSATGSLKTVEVRRPHPLIDRKVVSPLINETIFETEYSRARIPFLDDHRIFQKIVVSGASHLSLLLGAAKLAFNTPGCILEDILFLQAMVLPEDEARQLQLVFHSVAKDGRQPFSLISMATGETKPLEHATGLIQPMTGEVIIENHKIVDYTTIWVRCLTEVQPETVYKLQEQRQIKLGSSYRWIEAIRKGHDEAACRLHPPPGIDDFENWCLHPGLIDSCFGLMVSAIDVDRDATYIPFSIERFIFYGKPRSTSLWAHAQTRLAETNDDKLVGDIHIYELTGQVVAIISGLEGRRAEPADLLKNLETDFSQWLYDMNWEPNPLEPVSGSSVKASGQWIIIGDESKARDALDIEIRNAGGICRLLTYDYKDPEIFERNIAKLLNEPELRGVIHLLSVDIPSDTSFAITEDLQKKVCDSTIKLTRAIIQANMQVKLWLVTCGAQKVTGFEKDISPNQAALWGLGRTLAIEHDELECTLIDLDPSQPNSNMAALTFELMNSGSENQLALRNGERFIARLRQVKIKTSSIKTIVKSDSTYLVTGGLGGLGIETARWLGENQAGAILLVGRSEPSDIAIGEIQSLRDKGIRVETFVADISNPDQVDKLFSHIRMKLPPLKGIFHAAGIIDDGAVIQQTWPRFWKVMAPKVMGLELLKHHSDKLELDFLVCYSSMVSLMGAPMQANYAAANAFLDGFCNSQRQRGFPWVSINWGPFADSGIAARLKKSDQERILSQGLKFIPPSDGLAMIKLLLCSDLSQVAVIQINWSLFMQKFPNAAKAQFLKNFLSTKTDKHAEKRVSWQEIIFGAPVYEQKSLLLTNLRSEIARVLGIDNDTMVEPKSRLFDLGLDSLMAVELKNRIEKQLDCRLKSTIIFDYPTLDALTDYLLDHFSIKTAVKGKGPDILDQEYETKSLEAEVAAMSEEEAEALLLQQLDNMDIE